jgi:uncharacterized FlgJ-related protein
MTVTNLLRINCSALFFVAAAAVHSTVPVRNEIFRCDQVDKSKNDEHHKILKNGEMHQILALALASIPRINPASKADREFFLKAISSAVKKVNEFIIEQRKLVLLVQKKRHQSKQLTSEESGRFRKICRFYQTGDINELLLRVAPVPISLAAAQAAHESGFGSDELIHKLNAYFGLAHSQVRLIKFDTLFNSAIAYAKTLNVNPRFREFRQQRATMMRESARLEGAKLVHCVKNYGTDKKYCKLIGNIIELHKLNELDKAG